MTHLIALRLLPSELAALDALCKLGDYKSRTHTLRAVLIRAVMDSELPLDLLTAMRLERIQHTPRRNAAKMAEDVYGEPSPTEDKKRRKSR